MKTMTAQIIDGKQQAEERFSVYPNSLPLRYIQHQLDKLKQLVRYGQQEKIAISTMEGLHIVKLDTIVRIEGSTNYSTFFLQTGETIMTSKHLKHYEAQLPEEQFFRTHQSHLVNVHYIKKISTVEGNMVELEEGSIVPLARRRKEDLWAFVKASCLGLR